MKGIIRRVGVTREGTDKRECPCMTKTVCGKAGQGTGQQAPGTAVEGAEIHRV
jgi:hypothetical protein